VEIRDARPEEYAEVGALTGAVYLAEGLAGPDTPYLGALLDAGRRAKEAELVVAVDGDRILGSVTFAPHGSRYAELAGPGEAEFRMLVVDPAAQGRGVGAALVEECLRRARRSGASTLRLSTSPVSATAHRLYQRLGFHRVPELDWAPAPDVPLLSYAVPVGYCDRCGQPLAAGGHQPCQGARELEPPRWCRWCRRRMVVQVTPTGWTAHCTEHGTRHA
jgi:ribosomal protein S18 acetylase RimI-like enzyme